MIGARTVPNKTSEPAWSLKISERNEERLGSSGPLPYLVILRPLKLSGSKPFRPLRPATLKLSGTNLPAERTKSPRYPAQRLNEFRSGPERADCQNTSPRAPSGPRKSTTAENRRRTTLRTRNGQNKNWPEFPPPCGQRVGLQSVIPRAALASEGFGAPTTLSHLPPCSGCEIRHGSP